MSKAFTKDDADDAPVVIAPRAPLPEGVPNYVTPRGLARLREEHERLAAERASLEADSPGADRVRALAIVSARARDLEERIASATLVDPSAQPHDEIRFGAHVTVSRDGEGQRDYEIVGVDEADAAHGRVAFVAPLARALLGKRVGDAATLRTPRGEEELEVVAIRYDA